MKQKSKLSIANFDSNELFVFEEEIKTKYAHADGRCTLNVEPLI